jgi:hypothetical protein
LAVFEQPNKAKVIDASNTIVISNNFFIMFSP